MPLTRFSPHDGASMFGGRFIVSLLTGALLVVPPANAQNGAPAALPPALGTAPVAAMPTAPNFNILLLALDELPAPNAVLPAAPAPAPAPGPAAIAPEGAAAITPATAILPGGMRPFWFANADKKKDPDADLFRLEPEPRGLMPRDRTQPAATPDTFVPAPPLVPLPDNTIPLPPTAPPGRAQMVSIPLRRALLAQGWGDVLPTAVGGTAISRAVGERRLTTHTIDALKLALAKLAAPGAPAPDVTRRASLLAARIGQALGYRAVVAFYVSPSQPKDGAQNASFSFLVADSAREIGEPILFDEKGTDDTALREAGASTAAALLDKTLRGWPEAAGVDRAALAQSHLEAARNLIAAGDTVNAQDELNQTIALDSSRGEPYVMLGDLLANTDPTGAAVAYRRAVELNTRDGATWAKIAIAFTAGTIPDWPRALDAGRKAIAANYDSVPLRVAMATAQFGRADLFRKADSLDRAEDAEFDARKHLDRALELAPDDPAAVRLLARKLVETRRFSEATQTLDRVAPRYPRDIEIQSQYAAALTGQVGREEDAFATYARVWRLTGQNSVVVDAITYRALAQGFDLRVNNLGKSARQLTTGVANGALPREDALLQLTKLKEDMGDAENAINVLRAPASIGAEASASRVFAADLMNQALEAQQIYLETGQELYRLRGSQLNNQAIARLNAVR